MRRGKLLTALGIVVLTVGLLAGCAGTGSSGQPTGSQTGSAGQSSGSADDYGPRYEYALADSFRVNGRQGVAVEGDDYYISGSTTLARYDKSGKLLASNEQPFAQGYKKVVNHIEDIDAYNGELYCGVEKFLDGKATNIQIAIYDTESLKLKRTFNFQPKSGQTECSGITVNPDDKTVVMCSWANGDPGTYLYQYDLESGKFLGRIHMHAAPQWVQGVKYYDGYYYVTADDGNADQAEPDHIYRMTFARGATECSTVEEMALADVKKQGEIEGLTFDTDGSQLLVLYNRGARIVRGMPVGYYDGYKEEVHELYRYNFKL